ncbi:HAD family hydrolase [Calycomorphotria hydatis]|uniref:NLI interacting factor-like phosphatase n=1 Tax=Calycomorphotria hydatis TaxID=2528027 RepID=A0A517TBM6_9PLAN|nr:HAD family hydrolase [Calycomorphotria hydatis]QDT65782.1 NLI interacting factor-like phosphatase [Calycomorphotria hydatis]
MADEPLLILDVDETLIYASAHTLEHTPQATVGPYFVHERPGLSDFLNLVQRSYKLAVWSSSTADYLEAIISATAISESSLEFVWSRSRCTPRFDPEYQSQYYLKDLKKVKRLGYSLDHLLIVEDTPQKVQRNYGNAVYVQPFYGDPNDHALEKLGAYLVSIKETANFRSVEKRGWETRFSGRSL